VHGRDPGGRSLALCGTLPLREALRLLGSIPEPPPRWHPCKNAYDALREAGHDPEVVRSYGLALLPDALNRTHGRREAKRLTGNTTVPVLVTDDGEAIWDSTNIVAWAREHPAHDGDSDASPTAASGPSG
jgi:hypothetical protein